MYYILYSDRKGTPLWECVDGEDAMQIRVDELCKENDLSPDEDVMVFDADDELGAKATVTSDENTFVSYLYRDASNYKTYNSVVLAGRVSEQDLKTIKSALDQGEYFIPSQLGLPEKRFDDGLTEDDHIWFELDVDDIEPTTAAPTIEVTAAGFVDGFRKVLVDGWDEVGAMRRLGVI